LVGMFGLLGSILKCCIRLRGYQSYYEAEADHPAIRYYLLI